MFVLALLALFNPADRWTIAARCDRVELNHVQREDGSASLNQLIFWTNDPATAQFYVRDWMLVGAEYRLPCRPPIVIHDGHGMTLQVRYLDAYETWTWHDPEVANRSKLPCDRRRGLGLNSPRR